MLRTVLGLILPFTSLCRQIEYLYRFRQRIGRFGNGFFYFYLERGRELMLPDGVAVNSVQFEMKSGLVHNVLSP